MLCAVDNSPDRDDYSDIQDKISEVAVNFILLGQALQIFHSHLEIIAKKFKTDPIRGLKEVISAWLKQMYNVARHGKPTWRMLAKALAHPSGGANCALARKIVKNHPQLRLDQGNYYILMCTHVNGLGSSLSICIKVYLRPPEPSLFCNNLVKS